MGIRVALRHQTSYQYDRLVSLGPQLVRLRPAPHCRTKVLSYSLNVRPQRHFVNWQQDPHGNFLARFVFPEPTRELNIDVDLTADMAVINPFDFFVDEAAEVFPFTYEDWLARELRPFLEREPITAEMAVYLESIDRTPRTTIDFLVDLNHRLSNDIKYLIRLEPGVQSPQETLRLRSGSCRDSAWLFAQLARNLGLATRFVSGYLIQLVPDVKPLDGPAGAPADFTDLHAWAEVYLPGAGWIGFDPTSGLLAGEGHLPLACTPDPQSAAPITGGVDPCGVEFAFSMEITRVHEDPRVTRPYDESTWEQILSLGDAIDARLNAGDVRLTQGGEPTFVSIDDMDGAEWNVAAVGPHKLACSHALIRRLRDRFAPGGMLHFGQGKWYPGESLPRWAMSCAWRADQHPIWRDSRWIADPARDARYGPDDAERFLRRFAHNLGVTRNWITPVFEDAVYYLHEERRLPINVDPRDPRLKDPEARARMAKVFERGLDIPVGFVLPLTRQWWQGKATWHTGPWPVRSDKLFLLPGDSPIGLRLPIDSLPHVASGELPWMVSPDPGEPRGELPPPPPLSRRRQNWVAGTSPEPRQQSISPQHYEPHPTSVDPNVEQVSHLFNNNNNPESPSPRDVVRTALCVEPRDGLLFVFMPPVQTLEEYLELVAMVEQTAEDLETPVLLEGYPPPYDPRMRMVKVTPDPGVIEVNTQPAASWRELVSITTDLYEEARLARLGTEKFDLDGKHSGTGGGNHVVLGAARPLDSPFLRRPDLLKSLIIFWNNHPALSYLFSGRFIGPTSQAPRLDEGRRDALFEMEIALARLPDRSQHAPPWLVDRVFRNLLVDLTGNTHRAEFCIDKLYSPDSASGRLGLLEFRALEMPPHARMNLTQQLLIRGLIARFWDHPCAEPLIDWGTSLHDRFLLPHFVWDDFRAVLGELRSGGLEFNDAWFLPHFEFRFPHVGTIATEGVTMEIRTAIEPWYVLGEEPAGGGTVRFVDSSVERLQVKVRGMNPLAHAVAVNGCRVPLHPTGTAGEYVAGIRYRAWQPPSCLHPTIAVHTPLVFDLLDPRTRRAWGGCTYHVAHPAGRNYQRFPVNAYEAESRRAARFEAMGHSPGEIPLRDVVACRGYPLTLDLRRDV